MLVGDVSTGNYPRNGRTDRARGNLPYRSCKAAKHPPPSGTQYTLSDFWRVDSVRRGRARVT
jgi:hypothetical protein